MSALCVVPASLPPHGLSAPPRFVACLGFLGSSDNSSMLKPSDGINSLLISCRPGDMKDRERDKLNWSSSFFF